MRIDDVNKALEMVHAENPGKTRARDSKLDSSATAEEVTSLDRETEKEGETAGERYERRKASEEQENVHEPEAGTPTVNLEYLKIDALTEAMRRLSRILREREEDRADSLTDSNIRPALLSACDDLESARREKNIDKITESLLRITRAIEKIGQVSGKGRDSSGNLSKLRRVMEEIKDSALNMKSPDLGDELNNILNKIRNLSEARINLFATKARLLKSYEERRY